MFSKLLLSRQEFAKVIGKGGQMIANIRAKCGANIKGSDIDDDKRLVMLDLFILCYRNHETY